MLKEKISREERIKRELAGEPTGFEVLQKQKTLNKEVVTRLISLGLSNSQIHTKTGLAVRTVTRYRKEIGAKPLKIQAIIRDKEARVRRMVELIKKDSEITVKELARALGVSEQAVVRYRRERGIVSKVAKKSKERRFNKMVTILASDPKISRTKLAKELDVSKKTLRGYLNEYHGEG